jgi:hypothetical protein
MSDHRKNLIPNPIASAQLKEYEGFSGRTANSGLLFLLQVEIARRDMSSMMNIDYFVFTPSVVMAGHKLLDDMMNDVMRLSLLFFGKKGELEKCQEELLKSSIRKSLGSGSFRNPSKLDIFFNSYGLTPDPILVKNLKQLCDLRDIIFHDDYTPSTHDLWRSKSLEIATELAYDGYQSENQFLRWIGLVDWVENNFRYLYHSCSMMNSLFLFNEEKSSQCNDLKRPTTEDFWIVKRSRLFPEM